MNPILLDDALTNSTNTLVPNSKKTTLCFWDNRFDTSEREALYSSALLPTLLGLLMTSPELQES